MIFQHWKQRGFIWYCLGFLLSFILASCSSRGKISDTISEYSRNALIEEMQQKQKKTYPELIDLLGESAVLFSIVNDESTPQDIAGNLHQRLGNSLAQKQLFSEWLDDIELNDRLSQNSRLAQAKDIYLDSLTVVSVSDKDISNPLGRYLGVTNLFVFQIDKWPCVDCAPPRGLRMKLRVVDAASSYIVWTGIAEKKEFKPREASQVDTIILSLAEDLIDRFFHRFKKKWHRKRFDHLKKSIS